ncbi:hypothetical protein AnigIFM63309_002552 [Aspergillus niger]|nr:hypothetical protein AnigIFM63309_002552 [Aspergillus niger]
MTVPNNATATEYPSPLRLTITVFALFLAILLTALDQTIIGTAIPKITDQFNSVGDIGWYGSVYFLTSTALQPAYGRMYMLFDVKWSFLVAIFIFELGSLICAIAPNSATLIGGSSLETSDHLRAVRPSLGSGIGCRTIARRSIYRRTQLALVLLHQSLPVGAVSVAVIVLILHLPKTAPTGRSLLQRILDLDLIGITLLLPTMICLLLALQWGGTTYAWRNSKIIGLLIGFGLLLTCFVGSQIWLGEKATLPPRIMKMCSTISLGCFSFGFGGAYYLLMYYLPIYFHGVRNVSAVHSGIGILPILIAQSISSGAIGAGDSATTGISTGKWIGYQILTGVGVGAGFQIPMTAIQTILEQADIPIGSAAVVFFQSLGGAIVISVAKSVFENSIVKQISETAPDVSPRLILDAGATAFRTALADAGHIDELEMVLDAYMTGLRDVFWVALALALFAFVSSLPLEWRSVEQSGSETTKEGVASTEEDGAV